MVIRGDDKPKNGESLDQYIIVSDEALNRVVLPLTVVHGHVQLLRRRYRRKQVIGSDELDRTLAHLEEATRTMVTELSGIMRVASRSRGGSDPA